MKRFNQIVLLYFVIVVPITIAALAMLPAARSTEAAQGSTLFEWLNSITGYLLMVGVICGLYSGIALCFSKRYREHILTKITGIKERDEMEEMIVGKAARNTLLFTLGFIIFIFIMNLIQIRVSMLPPEQMVGGHAHNLSIKFKLPPLEIIDHDPATLFNYDLPLTVTGALLLLVVVQVVSFYYYSNKYRKGLGQ